MLTKIQVKRLSNVAKALRDAYAAKKKFDMTRFVFGQSCDVTSDFDEDKNEYTYSNSEANFCGTPACALGHFAARTDLQRLLKVAILKDNKCGGVKTAQIAWFDKKPINGNICPNYEDDRFAEYFGINKREMNKLFGSFGCGGARTALQAAKYIEKFIKQKQFPGRSARDLSDW